MQHIFIESAKASCSKDEQFEIPQSAKRSQGLWQESEYYFLEMVNNSDQFSVPPAEPRAKCVTVKVLVASVRQADLCLPSKFRPFLDLGHKCMAKDKILPTKGLFECGSQGWPSKILQNALLRMVVHLSEKVEARLCEVSELVAKRSVDVLSEGKLEGPNPISGSHLVDKIKYLYIIDDR